MHSGGSLHQSRRLDRRKPRMNFVIFKSGHSTDSRMNQKIRLFKVLHSYFLHLKKVNCRTSEVGSEVLEQFSETFPKAKEAFVSRNNGKYLCSLPLLCSQALTQCGVNNIVFSDEDTFIGEKFYSYRRANVTGRMASIISLN